MGGISANNANDVIKYSFWNLNGYKSKTVGNKLLNRDFLETIEECDVIGLAETHIHSRILDNLAIPGFSRIDYKIREPHSKGKCGSGGIALFSKEHISEFLAPIQNDNKDVIWVKIKKELLGEERDIYLATIYISPNGNKENIVNVFEKLRGEIEVFRSKGNIILQGDLNARTNNKDEIIIADKHDQEIEENFTAPRRNSEDTTKTDIRGEELLNICKALNLIIINGRKTGDPFGKITSYQWNGKSVVDYVISSLELFNSITYFKVGMYSPFVSDHCPLFYELHAKNHPKEIREDVLREAPISFYLDAQDKQKLITSLKTPEMTNRLIILDTASDTDPQNMVSEISNVLLEACSKVNIKPRRKPVKLRDDNPWFDKDCQKLKNSIKRKCRALRKNSSYCNLHSEILVENKLLKNTIKKKKEEYRLKIIDEMNIKRGDQKKFWKLLGKLKNPKTDQIFQNSISGRNWNNHFQCVLNDKTREIKYPLSVLTQAL